MILRTAVLAAGLLLAASASAQSAMNYAYSVQGDPQARPVQAFDDGRQLYIQLRNPAQPPAPIGRNGPVAYTIRGPYLVLPIMGSVQLRYGQFTAMVTAQGGGDYSPGVVSVTRPVEVSDAPRRAELPPPPPVAPQTGFPVAAPVATVSGEIVASGEAGTRRYAASAAPVADGVRALSYSEARRADTYAGLKQARLRADGTTDGAQALLAAQAACRSKGAECRVEYSGAASGTIELTTETR